MVQWWGILSEWQLGAQNAPFKGLHSCLEFWKRLAAQLEPVTGGNRGEQVGIGLMVLKWCVLAKWQFGAQMLGGRLDPIGSIACIQEETGLTRSNLCNMQ